MFSVEREERKLPTLCTGLSFLSCCSSKSSKSKVWHRLSESELEKSKSWNSLKVFLVFLLILPFFFFKTFTTSPVRQQRHWWNVKHIIVKQRGEPDCVLQILLARIANGGEDRLHLKDVIISDTASCNQGRGTKRETCREVTPSLRWAGWGNGFTLLSSSTLTIQREERETNKRSDDNVKVCGRCVCVWETLALDTTVRGNERGGEGSNTDVLKCARLGEVEPSVASHQEKS